MNRVNEVTKDCFNALIQLQNTGKDASIRPEHVYQRLVGLIDEMLARGKAMGMSETDLADITYAVVGFADELAQRKPGDMQDYWQQRPLQLHYFGENIAGEGFFDRLGRILADPSRVEALMVYHMTLQFGFEGRYSIRGGELELDLVRRRVREGLGRLLIPEPVSRRHLPTREPLRTRQLDFIVLWIGLFALIFAFCFVIVLRVSLDRIGGRLNDRGQTILQQYAQQAGEAE